VLERAERIGGQLRLAAAAPGHRELAASLVANYEALLDRANVDLRLGTEATAGAIAALEPDLLVLATGARPAPTRQRLDGVEVAHVWDVLAGARPAGRILIADWGGDAAALDCAELLAAEGRDVTLAVGAVMPGETLHQYTRNTYIARLSRAGVRFEHYLGLESARDGIVRFRNIFAPDLVTELETDALLVSLGRVPDDALLVDGEEAGDRRSPRGIEEAVLEGTLAARRAVPARDRAVA
jgi:pyruvate/2-oxoglutarate dehydrogenase complex dihydrolipoamide dehydrogenase (E3) component